MKRTAGRPGNRFIRAALILFIVLAAVYITLKIYIARSENSHTIPDGFRMSIFVTNQLEGYREPCG